MVFTSPIFLFLFLPITLAGTFALPARLRNSWLLLASLVFYAWGEWLFTLVMLGSILVNYAFGLWIARTRADGDRVALASAVAFNLLLLAVMKYGNFAVANVSALLGAAGLPALPPTAIALPLGISFFTFHAISYVVDVHRGDAEAQRNPFDLALYFLLFPHLIAGPIVRWHHVAKQIVARTVDRGEFALGVRRFVIGLGKKTLIANTVALPADVIFALPSDQLTPATAWLAVVCYTLQIYFDFSGYSDMAIGLAHMLGFTFRENFDYPYVAQSIREFWRRWHISLSTWFRDYLFIPMGGSRVSEPRVYVNLLAVFVLCGLWHGASWTFVVWGLYHGAFQILERLGLAGVLARSWRPLRHLYALLVVMFGWVLFRADTFGHALAFFRVMLDPTPRPVPGESLALHLDPGVALALVAGCIGATPIWPAIAAWRARALAAAASRDGGGVAGVLAFAEVGALAVVFVMAAATLSASTYNPFIYFRF
jgi:alginate O-acetyltransferase complex protein AlgI